ncbi:DUF4291 family protein [Streptomyces aureus]|uniref:DUF4291 family protein n=1 Tax=Streptomyces aureus TaxID=193461 RepID=UPI001FD82793|nr:DUF4291 family protein [Streptomyces aureus]
MGTLRRRTEPWTPSREKVCEHALTWIKPSCLWMMYCCGWVSRARRRRVTRTSGSCPSAM